MYDAEYGTGWSALTPDEAIERAYALGVSETLGEHHDGEFDRLLGEADTAHDRAMVRLAYDKGRNRGRSAAAEPSADTETVWTDLVNDAEREPVTVSSNRELPAVLRSLPLLEAPRNDLDRVRLPKFLLRR